MALTCLNPEMLAPLHIVLVEPVIPQNTGSIARLCACTGASLHLIHPLGFKIDEARVKRAGLDYWPHVTVIEHGNWEEFLRKQTPKDLYFFSAHAKRPYSAAKYPLGSYLVFGSETKGLKPEIWENHSQDFYTIPMRTNLVRSLNLAQSAAVVAYEALRQVDFDPILK